MFYLKLLLLQIFTCHFALCYKILIVLPTPFKSHFIIGSAIAKELAHVGHHVTLISPFELKQSNVRNVILTEHDNAYTNAFDLSEITIISNFFLLPHFSEKYMNLTLSHPHVQSLLESESFDVVIVEIFQSEVLYALGNHFNCPVIGVTTFGVSMWTNLLSRTPYPTSYVPNLLSPYSDRMTYIERLHNTFIWTVEEICWHFIHYPKQVALYQKYFPHAKPQLIDVVRNVSIVLNNNHFTTSSIKPTMPNTIEIGGIYVKEAKPLPNDIKMFLDSAVDGAILFSMGSIIQATDWPVEKREAFVTAFSKLKQKVIWKYENETLPNKPENVMISKWLPQRDILAHKNIKLFITHGGLLSTTEAIFEAVPILAIPIFGDQKMNMKAASDRGYGLMLDFHNLNEEILTNALDRALNGGQMSEKAREISSIYKDRPMTPQQAVVYWTEYVIRHKGAKHLHSAALDMNYFDFYNVDVYLTFLVMLLCIAYATITIPKFIFKRIFAHSQTKQKVQ